MTILFYNLMQTFSKFGKFRRFTFSLRVAAIWKVSNLITMRIHRIEAPLTRDKRNRHDITSDSEMTLFYIPV